MELTYCAAGNLPNVFFCYYASIFQSTEIQWISWKHTAHDLIVREICVWLHSQTCACIDALLFDISIKIVQFEQHRDLMISFLLHLMGK